MNGTPLPYLPASDSWVTLLMLLCILFSLHILSCDRFALVQEVKKVFMPRHENVDLRQATSSEMRHFLILQGQTALLAALLFVESAWGIREKPCHFSENLLPLFSFASVVLACSALRVFVYMLIGWIFFQKRQTDAWLRCYFATESLLSIGLLPIVLLCVYAGLPPLRSVAAALILLFLLKSLLFFKGIQLINLPSFTKLYFILYLCALEIIPLLIAVSGLYAVNNTLSLNL